MKISIAILLILTLFLSACAQEPIIVPQNTTSVQFNLSGFRETCLDDVQVFEQVDDEWMQVNRYLPTKGNYFLDGEYRGYGKCEPGYCNEITYIMDVELIKYEKTGTQKAPKELTYGQDLIADVYQKVPLTTPIKIDFTVFTDKNCVNEKTITKIIES